MIFYFSCFHFALCLQSRIVFCAGRHSRANPFSGKLKTCTSVYRIIRCTKMESSERQQLSFLAIRTCSLRMCGKMFQYRHASLRNLSPKKKLFLNIFNECIPDSVYKDQFKLVSIADKDGIRLTRLCNIQPFFRL